MYRYLLSRVDTRARQLEEITSELIDVLAKDGSEQQA